MTIKNNAAKRVSFIVPTAQQVAHSRECNTYYAEDTLFSDDYEPASTHYVYSSKIWWVESADCDTLCECGQVALIAALSILPQELHRDAVKMHGEQMRDLFSHFWSGQALITGTSSDVCDACSNCLTDGSEHVWEVYADACMLAEEFGEALASYAYDLLLGAPRYSPGTDSTTYNV